MFSLNSLNPVTKNICHYSKMAQTCRPATSCVRDQDAPTALARHMWETGSLNWAQFILQWFIRFHEFSEFLFHLGKTPMKGTFLCFFLSQWLILLIKWLPWGGACHSFATNTEYSRSNLYSLVDWQCSFSHSPWKDAAYGPPHTSNTEGEYTHSVVLLFSLKACPHQAKANAKAKIFFDVSRLFFWSLVLWSLTLSRLLSLGVNRPLDRR